MGNTIDGALLLKDDCEVLIKLKLKKSMYNILVEIACLILLIGILIYLYINWNSIPDTISAHYNALGKIDRMGSKAELLVCPIVGWLMYIGLTVIEQFPQIWNTGITVTEENKEQVYRIMLSSYYNHSIGGVYMNTEKLSVNVNMVDLGKIEMLVKRGIYTNKTDFVIKAINNELMKNESIINSTIEKDDQGLSVGIFMYDVKQLQQLKKEHKKIDLKILGGLIIQNNVPLELVKETINSVSVSGVFKAPADIKAYFNHK
jgi:Arc/MetJ-type ribon-helix-helix transcriptional regulator